MNHFHVNAINIPDAWFQLCYNIFEEGIKYKIDRGSFEGSERLEYPSVSVQINLPGIDPLIPEFPAWMNVPPPVSQEYLEKYFHQLMYEETNENCSYTYAHYLRPQIDKIIRILKDAPQTNQCCATIGDMNSIDLADPPCMKTVHFKIIEKRLAMYLYFRSNDLYSAWACNVAGMQLVKEWMADEIGVVDGPIFYYGSGLHLYDYQYEIVKQRTMKNEM